MPQMETEAEKLFPFDPLHCSTIPTVPGMKLEQELALDDQCKVFNKSPGSPLQY